MNTLARTAASRTLLKLTSQWLMDQALAETSLQDVVNGLCERLLAAGVPIARAHVSFAVLHPLYQSIGYTWWRGKGLTVEGQDVPGPAAVQVKSDQPVTIEANRGPMEVLLLQGRPIGEPVAQYGPFVMNTRAELEQAFRDYQRTQFGGWPFPVNAPVHPREQGRFAKHADGRIEYAEPQKEHAAP